MIIHHSILTHFSVQICAFISQCYCFFFSFVRNRAKQQRISTKNTEKNIIKRNIISHFESVFFRAIARDRTHPIHLQQPIN